MYESDYNKQLKKSLDELTAIVNHNVAETEKICKEYDTARKGLFKQWGFNWNR